MFVVEYNDIMGHFDTGNVKSLKHLLRYKFKSSE